MPRLRALRFAAWGNAVLRGEASPDDAVQHIVGADARHRVRGLPDETGEVGLALVFGVLRRGGFAGLGLALPSPGDPVGLSGPAEFNVEALAAQECVHARGGPPLGFIPEVSIADGAAFVVWHAAPANSERLAAAGSLSDAERDLDEALRDATGELARLDLARWDPQVAEDLAALRSGSAMRSALAPGYPARAHRVYVRALQVDSIVALAQRSESAALTAGAQEGRTSVLRGLDPVVRRAMMAAVNCLLEPSRHGGNGKADPSGSVTDSR